MHYGQQRGLASLLAEPVDELVADIGRRLAAAKGSGQSLRANVSKDFLYTQPHLRQTIMAERAARRSEVPIPENERPSEASVAVKLDVATKALTRLRAENAQLRADNARLLGELMTLRRASPPTSTP